MNRNGDLATMYETIPAVAGLNRVEGFDPSGLLSHTASPSDGEGMLQLSPACRKLWFRLVYPKGRLQTEKISITEQMAVFEARVYLDCSDTNPVSSFVSGCTREDAPGGRYIQEAQEEAMDRALTDAGFGLQFADICADSSTAGTGEKPEHCGTGAAVTAPGSAGNIRNAGSKVSAGNSGTAGSVVPAGNTGNVGNVVRPFPGASAGGGTKKVPTQGTQPAGSRQSAHTVTVPQGQQVPMGTRQPVHAVEGGQPAGIRQPVHAAVPQGYSVPMGTGQPDRTVAISQSQGGQSAGIRQPAHAAIIPQRQTARPSGTGQPILASVPQRQKVQPVGGVQGAVPAMPWKQELQPAGSGQPVQAAMSQGQGGMSAEIKQPFTSAMPQKQTAQSAGTSLTAQETKPASNGQPPQAAMPQGQGMQPGRNGNLAQPESVTSAAAGKAAPEGARPGENVRGSTGSGEQAAVQNSAVKEPGKPDSSEGVMGGERPVKEQRYFENTGVASVMPQNQPLHNSVTARPAAPQEMPGRLPVPPVSMEGRGTVQPGLDEVGSTMDSLPVPPVGKTGQVPAEAATAIEDTLPVPADSREKRDTRSSVQEAMALLKGNAHPTGAAGTTGGGRDNIPENAAGNTVTGPAEAASPESHLPVNGKVAQGEPAPRYTADMPVEDIVSLMTLEEAGKVVVDTGASRGLTVAEVAERRPPTLKYYRYGGYKGNNNILRAATQVILDSMEGQKVG